jgi:hypothetical protein
MGQTMKIYGYILLSLLFISCSTYSTRNIASADKSRTEIQQSIFHDLQMSESHLKTAKINGYREYMSSLSLTELENLQSKIKSIKNQSKEIHQQVTDWISTLSPSELRELKGQRR